MKEGTGTLLGMVPTISLTMMLVFSCLHHTQAARPLFQPKGCSRATWLRYNGCSENSWKQTKDRCKLLNSLLSRASFTPDELKEHKTEKAPSPMGAPIGGEADDWVEEWPSTSTTEGYNGDAFDTELLGDGTTLENEGEGEGPPGACVAEDEMLEADQVEALIERLQAELEERGDPWPGGDGGARRRRRKKRKVIKDFKVNRWGTTIPYIIDGNFAEYHDDMIRKALRHWERDTCLKFVERNVTDDLTESTILFVLSRLNHVCYSYIGRTLHINPQPIYLSPLCFTLGVLAHEIGHTLGLVHEHQRPDRDEYITVRTNNIANVSKPHFAVFTTKYVETQGLPYDYGSDMHYRMEAFSRNGYNTIETKDSRFQRSIGQRVMLSFWDYRITNSVYCNNTCQDVDKPDCKNQGYQDPKNCHKCLCPDGWSGDLCDDLAPAVGAHCGGYLTATSTPQTLTSPFYFAHKDIRHYDTGQECNWLITAPAGERVVLTFEGDFGVFCYKRRCLHWLELRYGHDLGISGPRYCCTYTPTETIVSDTNQLMAIFKAVDTHSNSGQRRGFRLKYVKDGDECGDHPCANGGTCLDGVATYTCVCRDWYTGPNCEEFTKINKQDSVVDLVFMLDASNITGKNFNAIKAFTKDTINNFHYSEDMCHMGLMTFDDFAHTRAALNSHRTIDGLLQTIDDVTIQRGSSNYYTALWLLYSDTFMEKYGDRRVVPNVAVMITDGSPSDYMQSKFTNSMLTVSQSIRQTGTQIIIVAIGNNVPRTLLENIAGDHNQVIFLPDYDALSDLENLKTLVLRIQERAEYARQLTTLGSSSSTTTKTTSPTSSATTSTPSTTTTKSTTTTTKSTTTTTTSTTTPSTTTSTTTPSTTTTTTIASTTPSTTKSSTTSSTTSSTSTPTPPTPPTPPPKITSPSKTASTSTTSTPSSTSVSTSTKTTPSTSVSTSIRSTLTSTQSTGIATSSTVQTMRPNRPPRGSPPAPPESNSSEDHDGEDQCSWIREECSKDCGGCGYRRVTRVCPLPEGKQRVILRFIEQCNAKVCPTECWFYIAGFYKRDCKEACCPGYEAYNDICVLKS